MKQMISRIWLTQILWLTCVMCAFQCITNSRQNTNILSGLPMVCNEAGRRIARAMKPGKNLTKLQDAERTVKRLVPRTDLTDNQFSALVCLLADVGTRSSRIRRFLEATSAAHTEDQWRRVIDTFKSLWELEESQSRQRRRKAEAALFVKPSLIVNRPEKGLASPA